MDGICRLRFSVLAHAIQGAITAAIIDNAEKVGKILHRAADPLQEGNDIFSFVQRGNYDPGCTRIVQDAHSYSRSARLHWFSQHGTKQNLSRPHSIDNL